MSLQNLRFYDLLFDVTFNGSERSFLHTIKCHNRLSSISSTFTPYLPLNGDHPETGALVLFDVTLNGVERSFLYTIKCHNRLSSISITFTPHLPLNGDHPETGVMVLFDVTFNGVERSFLYTIKCYNRLSQGMMVKKNERSYILSTIMLS